MTPLLLIHGAAGTHRIWDQVVNELPGARAVDLPGHSAGTPLERIEDYADWLLAQTSAPSVLVGYAMGGSIAMEAALRAPGRVAALVLVNSGARIRVLQELFQRLEADFPTGVNYIWENAAGRGADGHVITAMVDASLTLDQRVVVADFKVVNRWDALSRVANIDVPTLVVAGSDDLFTPPRYSEFLAGHIPNATLRIIEGAGHIVPMEAAQELCEEVRSFLTSHRLSAVA